MIIEPIENNINIDSNQPSISTSGVDWDTCNYLPNMFWDKDSECKQNEKRLFDVIENCAFTSFGVEMEYYIVDYNTQYDKIFGEDNDRYVIRMFDFKSFYTLPDEKQLWTSYGIEGIDNFHIYANISHIEYASTLSGDDVLYDSYTPKIGDVLKAKYNNYFYEIIMIKKTSVQFLQAQYTYEFTVRPYRDFKWSLSPLVSGTDIANVVNSPDILEINSTIEVEKETYLFDDWF